ncbi:MAG: hypothetical protein JNK53_00835, partial [Phycisphaerae bacterium]|nr:hypothetical protein [Phycisphaerae bacterium]
MATDRTLRERGALVVVQPRADGAAWLRLAAECAALLRTPACVVGTGDDARQAQRAGLHVVASCAPPFGRPSLGWRAMLRAFAPH